MRCRAVVVVVSTVLLVAAGCGGSPDDIAPTPTPTVTASPSASSAPPPALGTPVAVGLDAVVEGGYDVDVVTADGDAEPVLVTQEGPFASTLHRGADPATWTSTALPFQGLGRTAVLAAGVGPDGTAVLLGQLDSGPLAVARVPADGPVTTLPSLSPLPDGASRLAVLSADAGTVVLAVLAPATPDRVDLTLVDATTGAVRAQGALTGLPVGAELRDLAVAPDGSLTAATVGVRPAAGGAGRDLLLVRADAALGPLPPVTVGAGLDPDRTGVDVTSDGTAVVLTRGAGDGPGGELVTVAADADRPGPPVSLGDGPGAVGVAVTPDGATALVVSGQQLVAVSLGTGESTVADLGCAGSSRAPVLGTGAGAVAVLVSCSSGGPAAVVVPLG